MITNLKLKSLWNLKKSSIRLLTHFVENNKENLVFFDLKECMEKCKYETHQPIYKGLNELLKNKILFKVNKNFYKLNKEIVFNEII